MIDSPTADATSADATSAANAPPPIPTVSRVEIQRRVAAELSLAPSQVEKTLELFGDGATLPFIARYRKEVTGGLDEVQLRDVRDRAEYLREMEDRRVAIMTSIHEQGKLDGKLRGAILAADSKQALEDLYLPYKPKRRTRAMIARERGLAPLAEAIWNGRVTDAEAEAMAESFVTASSTADSAGVVNESDAATSAADVPTVEAALQGARDILAEQIAEVAEVRGWIRDITRARGTVTSSVIASKRSDDSKFKDYFEFSESLGSIPSHRMLAIRRGESEGELLWRVVSPVDEIVERLNREIVAPRKAVTQLSTTVADAYKRILAPAIEVELRVELKTRADDEAITIFGRNLEQLLLSSPAGEKRVIGFDPGFRTGVKVAVVSATGALLHTDTLYLHQEDRFSSAVRGLVAKFNPDLVAVGNGTASRETETVVKQALRDADRDGDKTAPNSASRAESYANPVVVVVSEAGASVYSASDLAREEFPDLDVSLRGAVSIARRLQDPLAELVKIDPKSIGVGQYQHDVHQPKLKQRLDDVVESCVNRVGVEVNTASAALLAYVAGIGPGLANAIVTLRNDRGRFESRATLRDVPRLGAKAFEQAAGFLRVRGGSHPLDGSAVHPERYALVEQMARDSGADVASFVGNEELVDKIDLSRYVSDDVGMPTLRDIVAELKKPGRDPRAAFEPPAFRDDITKPADLLPGMVLEGVVTNIVAFGCFVDVGVHQDGLVHVSQLANRYVRDPNEVVKVGQRVKVTVQGVDLARGRIALTMRTDAEATAGGGTSTGAPAGGAGAAGERGARGGRGANDRRGGQGAGDRGAGKASGPANAKPGFVPKKGSVAPNGMRFK